MSTIIQCACPGMANRIKSYVSLMGKYDIVKTCNFSDSYIFNGIDYISDGDVEIYPVIMAEDFIEQKMWQIKVFPEEYDYIDDYITIDYLYEKTPQYFIDKYLPFFDMLDINKEIINYVDNFTKNWVDVVGVHIRSWYCSKHQLHDNSIFEEEIDKIDKNTKIFFCSDNSDVQNHFVEKYGDRIITYDREIYNTAHKSESGFNHDLQSNIDAFMEMLILSKCTTIIGTFSSTFDEVSWWLSNCKSKVIIPTPLKVPSNMYGEMFIKK